MDRRDHGGSARDGRSRTGELADREPGSTASTDESFGRSQLPPVVVNLSSQLLREQEPPPR